ncbi:MULTISPECIES: carnitine 3-dehydrogenase [unclassified Novosphingobium]|uniref:carnitine 3-dehydrogenase n=1 Tax=unclassified Novosphingobium TaxID=2644732 RepID=UPI0017FF25DB|nr:MULTISPECIES: carnitine 3-dehydrogenase [unclassified Novosphingobium]NMN05183.1 carnitine 3-dehydrogenase [Novosphingobium sp. SG919]NMN87478.1 carnitine 3-dehydrogenase [Novosphingobium sp. SG916]
MAVQDIARAGLVGGGVIGAGWAARMLLNGIDVAIFDPDPEIERKVTTVLAAARRAWDKLVPGALPPQGHLRLAASVEDAVADADFVQESLPEREDLKIEILARIDAATRPDVIIGSSTSGLLPTRLQSGMAHPERLVVGHPFNPVYLLPLVEICGGAQTSAQTRERAAAFYTAIGMHPLHVRKEIDGFIADRLLEALWREALWLVNDGVATTEEIDDAVRFGAGLRWSFMGTFLIYRMAGGEAGMRHFLAQFGPALKLPWTKLEAPELTQDLIDTVAAQSDDQAASVSIRDLERQRDDCLIAVLSGLRGQDYGAGRTLAAYARRLMEHAPAPLGSAPDEHRPLALHSTDVPPDWIDYNGHMTEHRYLQVFGDTTDALLRHIGVDAAYLASEGSWFTVETHIRHLGETHAGDRLIASTQVLGADAKRAHVFHSLFRSRDGQLVATAEQMLLHVAKATGRAGPATGIPAERMAALAAAQADLPVPDGAGRRIALG